jgi:hypothetical protein
MFEGAAFGVGLISRRFVFVAAVMSWLIAHAA